MGIMGWSDSTMAARYQHVTAEIRRDIANRVGGLIWETSRDRDGGREEGSSGVPARM